MQRTRGEAGSEGRVERRKAVRGPLLKLKGPSTEVSLGTGRGFSPSMDTIAVIGEKTRQSNCKRETALMAGRAGDKRIACFLPATAE